MKPTFTFYAGDFAVGKWAAGQLYELEDTPKQERLGRLAIVLEFAEVAEGQEAEVAAEAVRRAGELYYGQSQTGVAVLEEVWRQLREEFVGLEGGMVVLRGETVEIARYGAVGVWVKQPWASGWVLSVETNQASATGRWQQGSELIVGNAGFWRQLGEGGGKKDLGTVTWGENTVGMRLRYEAREAEKPMLEPIEDEEREEPVEQVWHRKGSRLSMPVVHMPPGNPKEWGKRVWGWVSRPAGNKPWRKASIWGVALLVLLAIVFLLGRTKKAAQLRAESGEEKQIVQLVETFSQAKLAVGVSREEARQQVGLTKQQLASLSEEQKKDPRVLGVQSELPGIAAQAEGVKLLTGKELAHLELVREGVGITSIDMDEKGGLWVVDGTGDRLFKVQNNGAVELKKGKSELGEVSLVATYPQKLFTWANTGIVQCTAVVETCATVVKADSEWKQIAGMKIWAGNIYLLDPGAGQVWKYPVTETGFGNRQDWIATTSTANASGRTSMAIDGNVWLAGGADVLKLVSGNAETVALSGLDKGLGADVELFTSDTVSQLYLLDRVNKRVVVTDKTGHYVEQWSNEKFGQARGLVVDEKQKKAFFGVGSVVWEADF